jgi:hypothetical protein
MQHDVFRAACALPSTNRAKQWIVGKAPTSHPGREVTMKRVAIYLWASTDKQTTGNQRRELEAVVERSGWKVEGL